MSSRVPHHEGAAPDFNPSQPDAVEHGFGEKDRRPVLVVAGAGRPGTRFRRRHPVVLGKAPSGEVAFIADDSRFEIVTGASGAPVTIARHQDGGRVVAASRERWKR